MNKVLTSAVFATFKSRYLLNGSSNYNDLYIICSSFHFLYRTHLKIGHTWENDQLPYTVSKCAHIW